MVAEQRMQILGNSALIGRAALVACGICAAASAAGQVPVEPQDRSSLSEPADAATPIPQFQLIEHSREGDEQPHLSQPVAKPRDLQLASFARRPASSTSRDRVLALIRATELRHRLPAGLLDALVATESNYRPFAVSRAGAAGLAQLMPGTARDLGVIDRFDVRANLDGGARYLRAMLDRFGTITLALAAYNAGPNAVARSRGIPLNGETPAYVARVIARWRDITNDGR
jgi:soluble lytic murein transglycosylase-like protein